MNAHAGSAFGMAIPILLGKHCSVRDSESCASLAPHRSMNSLKTGRLTISLNPDDASNVRETYSVNVVRGDRRSGTRASVTNATGGAATFDKPIDNIGRKSIPDYQACAAKHVYAVNIPGCNTPARLFAGQRKDPFVVNLGETFDLINIKAPAVEFLANAERKSGALSQAAARHAATSRAAGELRAAALSRSTCRLCAPRSSARRSVQGWAATHRNSRVTKTRFWARPVAGGGPCRSARPRLLCGANQGGRCVPPRCYPALRACAFTMTDRGRQPADRSPAPYIKRR